MGILLAARIAKIIGGSDIRTLVDRTIFRPLGMEHSTQGLGRFKLEEVVPCQTEGAAPEAGGGDPQAREWDWNSPYWRGLGAPGEGRTPPRRTSPGSWTSSWGPAARP